MTERVVPDTVEREAPAPTSAPSAWIRHDAIVVAAALALLAIGGLAYRSASAQATTTYSSHGLTFERPARMLPPLEIEVHGSALAGLGGAIGADGEGQPAGLPVHQLFKSPDGPLLGVEVLVDVKPDYRGLTMWLQLTRQTRYGEFHWAAATGVVQLDDREWQRCEFQYAVKATEDDAPQVATGVEYATVNGSLLYVVTVHGTPDQAHDLEQRVLRTLAVK